ncbi:MAG: MlaC/ttg2D family ABC transporter substrate-binding protein [Rhodospirillales bacterium]
MRIIRTGVFGILGALALVFWAGPPAAHAGDAEDAAAAFVLKMARDAVSDLTDPAADRTERARRLTILLNERFAGEKIARWIIGRHWKKATEAQRARYLDVYTRLMVESYVDRFNDYSGEKLQVLKASRHDEKDIIVKTELRRPTGQSMVKIDWRVRDTDGDLRVLDLMVEGISMVVAQRAEFASAIRRAEGDMEAFLDDLEGRVKLMASAAGDSGN